MKYYDNDIMAATRAALERRVLSWPGVTTKPMFGCPCYRANDQLFAVLVTGGLVLTQLPDAVRTQVPSGLRAEPFEVNGRRMKRWLRFPVTGPASLEPLADLLQASYAAALQNPDAPRQ